MKLQAKTLVSILILVVSIFAGQSHAQQMRRYIVTIKGPAEEAVDAVLRAGGGVIHVYDIIPAIAIQIPEQALAGLERNPLVMAIEPDSVVTTFGKPGKPSQPPTQPDETIPWGVDRIDAELAWSAATGAGVNVAVVDTGIDSSHPDLIVNYAGGTNIISPSKSPMDDNGHGTHVAGIIAAADNNIGVVGVAPQASLYAVKVLNRSGMGWTSDIIEGVEWCWQTHFDEDSTNDIDIVNMSLGGGSYSQNFQDACNNAWAAGVILVAAAGNDGANVVSYPAAYGNVVAVSATDSLDHLASWSNYGDGLDIAAPGVSIKSTYKGGGYATLSGTSMASPHVAGTLALVVQLGYSGNAAISRIATTAEPIGSVSLFGCGLVDAEGAATGAQTLP